MSHLLTGSRRTWRTCSGSGPTGSTTTCGATCHQLSWPRSSSPPWSRWPSALQDTAPGWRLRSEFRNALLSPVHCTPLYPHFIPPALFVLQGMERFQSYPTWASAMAYFLIVVALLPLPVVFIARRFNLVCPSPVKPGRAALHPEQQFQWASFPSARPQYPLGPLRRQPGDEQHQQQHQH